jgi:parallel beta-helix repeat protein
VRAAGLLAALASLVLGIAVVAPGALAPTISVPGQYATLAEAIEAAPAGAVIRLGPGTYAAPLLITRPLSLVGAPDRASQIVAQEGMTAIAISDVRGVRLQGLAVVGGDYGITVDRAEAVQLIGNRVTGALRAGIRLSRAAALIKGNEIRAGRGPYGMGIELANTMSRPPSVITGNVVAGATQEGIILHNSHAMIESNTVTGNGLRGVSISEMSMATVAKNKIMDNADAGIWVVDSSMADIAGNHIAGMRPGPEGRLNGIGVFYYGEVMLGSGNRIEVDADRAIVATFGGTVESRK